MTALLRTVRRQRGLTLQHLAETTGLTRSYLSKIERGQATPSIAVALKVADALGVDVARLFAADGPAERLSVDRAGGTGRYRPLAADQLGKAMSPFMVHPTVGPGDDPRPTHTGQELVFVHTGTVQLRHGDTTVTLHAGDSAYFDAGIDHSLRQLGDEPAAVLVVAYREPGAGR